MTIICVKCPPHILKMFLDHADKVILVMDSWDTQYINYDPAILSRLFLRFNINSLDSIEELSAVCVALESRGIRVHHSLSGAEYGMFASGFLNSVLSRNIRHLSLAIATRDKRTMKLNFKRLGIPCANFTTISNLKDPESQLNHKLKYPIVAKPVCGMGTFNTEKIVNQRKLRKYFKKLALHPAIVSQQIVLEEFMEGEEFHIDAVWKNYKCEFFVIYKYIIPRIQILSNPTKNGSCLIREDEDPALYRKVKKTHGKLGRSFGIEKGVTHTEFFLNRGRLYYSEIASRFVGAYAPEAIEKGTGVDLINEWVRLETGYPSRLSKRHSKFNNCGWLHLSPLKSGRVGRIPTEAELLAIPWISRVEIRLKKGDNYSLDNPSNWAIFLLIEANSFKDYLKKSAEVHRRFKIPIKSKKKR